MTQAEIRTWLEEGLDEGATHVLVLCDGFSSEYYPHFVRPWQSVQERYEYYQQGEMQRVMEVYCLHLDIDEQLAEKRAFHFDSPDAVSRLGRAGNQPPP